MKQRHWLLTGLLIVIACLPYVTMFGNQFVWDDHEFIVNNQVIRRLLPLTRFFTPQGLVTLGDIYPATGSRPLMTISLALDYAVWKLNPFGFHLTNLFLHGLCVLGVFMLVNFITRRFRTAFIAGLLFGVMPGHAEAVIAFLGRSDLLATLFILFGMLAYLRAGLPGKNRWIWYTASLVLAAAACLAKESGLIIIVLAAAAEFLFRRSEPGVNYRRLLPLFAIGILYWLYRGWVLKGNTAGLQWWGGSLINNFLMMSEVILKYLVIIFWPMRLSPLHSVDVPSGLKIIHVVGMITAVMLILMTVWLARKNRMLGFFGCWVIAGFLPVSNILPIPGMIMAERWLYLPSIGLCSLTGWLLTRLSIGSMRRRLVFAVVAGLTLLGGARGWLWGPVWKNEETVARAGLQTSPRSPICLNNLGKALLMKGRVVDAEAKFRQALRYKPDYGVAHLNLAMALREQGRMEEARAECYQAVEYRPQDPDAHSNLAVVLWRLSDWSAAFEHFQTAIQLNPRNEKYHYNFGLALHQAGLLDEALSEFQLVAELNPDNIDAALFIGYALGRKGQYQEAEQVLRNVLVNHPELPEAHYNLAGCLEAQGRRAEAAAEYELYIRWAPGVANRRLVEDKIKKLKIETP